MRIDLLLLLSIYNIFCIGMEKSTSKIFFSLYHGPGMPVLKSDLLDRVLSYINSFRVSLSCTCCNTDLFDMPIKKIKNKEVACYHAKQYEMYVTDNERMLTREEIRNFFIFERKLELHAPKASAFNMPNLSQTKKKKSPKKESPEDELLLLPLLKYPTEKEEEQIESNSWIESLPKTLISFWQIKGK